MGEPVVELRVQLKVCESCGCLWCRSQGEAGVYCRECNARLQEFPSPESRKRRGRPAKRIVANIWAVAETAISEACLAEAAMVEASGGAQ